MEDTPETANLEGGSHGRMRNEWEIVRLLRLAGWTGLPGLIKALGENQCSSRTLAKSRNSELAHCVRQTKLAWG